MSTLLYISSTVFICYLSFMNVELSVWNGLLWIIVLFAVTNAANRIFLYESGHQRIYLYTLADAKSVIVSKLIYQWIVNGILAMLVLLMWILLFNRNIAHLGYLILTLILTKLPCRHRIVPSASQKTLSPLLI